MEEEQNPSQEPAVEPAKEELQTGDVTVLYTGNADTFITKAGSRKITFDATSGKSARVSIQELEELLQQPDLEGYLTKLN